MVHPTGKSSPPPSQVEPLSFLTGETTLHRKPLGEVCWLGCKDMLMMCLKEEANEVPLSGFQLGVSFHRLGSGCSIVTSKIH